MALASLDDINTHLPIDKLDATDGNPEVNFLQVDVERLIKGYLSTVFQAAVLAAWDEPASTPEYIRACAGRLVAAFYYAKRYSEDIPDWDNTYPQRLYQEAMNMLLDVRTGVVDLPEVVATAAMQFDLEYFWPNSTTREPLFNIDMRF